MEGILLSLILGLAAFFGPRIWRWVDRKTDRREFRYSCYCKRVSGVITAPLERIEKVKKMIAAKKCERCGGVKMTKISGRNKGR